MKSVAILLPTLNEEASIGKIISEIKKLDLTNYNLKIYVADSYSTDNTVEIAKKQGVNIILEKTPGKGAAVKKAFKEIKSDFLIMLDSDLTYPPKYIPKFLEKLENYDVVFGSRLKGNIEEGAMSSKNKFGNKCLTLAGKFLFNWKISDLCTGYWGFTKKVYKSLNISANRFELEANILSEISKRNYSLFEILINYRKREGENKLKTRDGANILFFLLKEKFNKEFLESNFFIIFLFVISTLFFIMQHSTGTSWDFSVYLMNAKYWLNNGIYLEWARAPLPSFIFGIFSFLGWKISEYLYIIFVSLIFALSSVKLSSKLNIDKNLFYFLELTPLAFLSGLRVGTELLSLALLQLSIAYIKTKKVGFFLGLSFLTRYTNVLYSLIVIFKKNFKKIILAGIIFGLTIIPWLLFNYINSGSFFTSLANSYAMNVKFRTNTFQIFDLYYILLAIGWYLPFFIYGLYLKYRNKFNEYDFLILFFLAIAIISYLRVPVKNVRYLFNIILPVAYFSYFSFSSLIKKYKLNKKKIILLIISLNLLLSIGLFTPLENIDNYNTVEVDCMCASNNWVYFNTIGVPCTSAPWKESLDKYVGEGYRIILFGESEPYYQTNSSFIEQFPILENKSNYLIIGDPKKCKDFEKVNETYLDKLRKNNQINLTPEEVIFDKFIK